MLLLARLLQNGVAPLVNPDDTSGDKLRLSGTATESVEIVMDISWISRQVKSGDYELSRHADEEREVEKITMADIEQTLYSGEIIEDYPKDPGGPSCLVLGYTSTGYPIHIVCGQTPSKKLRIITVYTPSFPKWIDPRTRRR